MIVPVIVPSLERPTISVAGQAQCVYRAGGMSPQSQPAKHLAVNLRAQRSCCQQPAQDANLCSVGVGMPIVGRLWQLSGRDVPVTTALVLVPVLRRSVGH